MSIPDPKPGLVIRYGYLWWDEQRRGQEEGDKDRPCVTVSAYVQAEAGVVVIVAPITHTLPYSPAEAVEVPAITKHRLGLDEQRSWVVVSEVNRFVWPGPDLRLIPGTDKFAYGYFSPKLFAQVRQGILSCSSGGLNKLVSRSS